VIRLAATVLFALVSLLPAAASAQSTAGAQVLLITPGARADAMGRAYVAVANDATATWWNPAALAHLEGSHFSAMAAELVPGLAEDVVYRFYGFARGLEGTWGVGVNLLSLAYGRSFMDEGASFESSELAVTAAAGVRVTSGLSVGASAKYVKVEYFPADETRGNTVGFDLAAMYRTSIAEKPTSFAVAVQNVGPDVDYGDREYGWEVGSDPIGHNLKVGGSCEFARGREAVLLGSFDFNQPLVHTDPWEEPILNAGAELGVFDVAALRFGYIYDHEGTIEDWTYGIGIGREGFSLDYASVPQSKYLDQRVHKLGVNAALDSPGLDLRVSAGPAWPSGDWGDAYHPGVAIRAGADVPVVPHSATRIGTTLQVADFDLEEDERTSLTVASATLNVKHVFAAGGRVRPSVTAGIGGYSSTVAVEDRVLGRELDFGLTVGAGAEIGPAGDVSATIDVALHQVMTDGEALLFLPVTLGLRF